MTLPNFFVIGAAKSGTTALYHYLGQHPQIFLPIVQEPNYFAFGQQANDYVGPGGSPAPERTIGEAEEYEALFAGSGAISARGDISPLYLYVPGTAERLKDAVPDAKVLVILRNPVDRAYSAYMHACRDAREPISSFLDAVRREPQRVAANWGFLWRYTDMGFYSHRLARYYSVFPSRQVLVLLYDDLVIDAVDVCRRIASFLHVDFAFTPRVDVRYNVSGIPRSRLAHNLLGRSELIKTAARVLSPYIGYDRLRRLQASLQTRNLQEHRMSVEARSHLLALFEEEIDRLSSMIDRNLQCWRQ